MRRARNVSCCPLVVAPGVQHGDLGPGVFGEVGQVGEGGHVVAFGRRRAAELVRGPDRGGIRAIDADPHELALGVGDLLRRLADQGEGRSPRQRPPETGGELVAQHDADAPLEVSGGIGHALTQVDDRELSVGDLCEALNLPQSNVSQHLAVLRDRGVVPSRRVGTSVLYSLRGTKVLQAVVLLREFLAEDLAEQGRLGQEIAH